VAGSACRLIDPTVLLLRPGALAETGATVWTSTPSLANLLLRRGASAKDALRGLRWSFFCGEPLTRHTARTWQGSAGGRIDNIYGPTEATVVVFGHEVRPDDNPNDDVNAVVPIGRPFPGVQTDITADGELLLAGAQVFGGYYGEPPRTSPWYHTGDRVTARADGTLSFLGRIDDQVKVLGHRVELGEIEAAVRDTGQAHEVAAIAWPLVDGVAQSVTLFVANEVRLSQLYAALGERLPKALLPKRVIQVDTLPLTGNGKVDRRALREMM
jgi:acyl-coenzyme A synthetase/AMP-(fatty) acid ligase